MMMMMQVSLEENRVLEALVACEPEALVSLEDAALPARSFLKRLYSCFLLIVNNYILFVPTT